MYKKKEPNKIIYQDNIVTKFLVETQEHGDFEILVDTEDYDRIKNYRWGLSFGEKRNSCYIKSHYKENGKYKYFSLHRFILDLKDSKILCDHINRNAHDNRKQNLRKCTPSESTRNTSAFRKKAINFKGLSQYKETNTWQVRIQCDGKRILLGYFKDPIEGAKAYNKKAKELFGEFAYLNPIPEEV
jgi:hypothetical protein